MKRGPVDVARLYAEIADEYGGAVERLARGYERDPDKRRDLLQEIHVALWRSLSRFDGRCSTRTWVYRVAHNVATSLVLRRKGHQPTLVSPTDLESIADPFDSHDRLDRQRTLDRLYDLIRELRPIDRQVTLLYLEDIDAARIAEITGLTAGSIATRVHRIKHALAKQFHRKDSTDD